MCIEYDLVRFMINRALRLLFSPLTQLVRIELERAKWHFNCAQPHYNSTTVKIFCIWLATLQIVFLATLSSLKKLFRKNLCWKFCRKFLITQIRSNREFLYVTCWFDKKGDIFNVYAVGRDLWRPKCHQYQLQVPSLNFILNLRADIRRNLC